MEGYVEQRREIKFVGVRVVTTPDDLPYKVPEARDQLLSRAAEIQSVTTTAVQLGVTHPSEPGPTENDIVTYIGFEVNQFGEAPQGMRAMQIPAGQYARFEWQGPFGSPEFERFYPGIFGWLAQHNLSPRPDSPWVEVYDDQTYDWYDRDNPANRLTVLIPIGAHA